MVTFITLVVTALIIYIITRVYYKHKSFISQEGNSHALAEDTKRHDPAYATTIKTNITMDTNPAYGTATAIKMDTNPAYGTATAIKMDTNPAYGTDVAIKMNADPAYAATTTTI